MRTCLAVVAAAIALLAPVLATAQSPLLHRVADWWHPAKQNAYMYKVCGAASTALELDECQYVAESLIDNLRDCMRRRSPHAATCASLLPGAQAQLQHVNKDPTLLEHREDQREAQRQNSIRHSCALSNGGYYSPGYVNCVRRQDLEP